MSNSLIGSHWLDKKPSLMMRHTRIPNHTTQSWNKPLNQTIAVEDVYSNFRTTFAVTEGYKGGFVKVMSAVNPDHYASLQSPKSVYQTGTMIRRDSLKHRYYTLINKK